MTTDTARLLPATAPAKSGREGGRPNPPPSRRQLRERRNSENRSRRGLVAGIVICAGVPVALLASLWTVLNVPFWYNEQWRAYNISQGGDWWAALKGDGAPFPAGWYFLERATGSVFGSTELVLRIPTAIFIVIGCVLLMLLAKRWLPVGIAVVVALLGTLTGTLFSYGVQLSEYQIDATAVVGVLLSYELATEVDDPTWSTWRLYAFYGGIALACIFSTPAVFVAGPLLVLDVGREVLHRRLGPRLLAAFSSGVLALLHLALFVLPQSALTASPFWDSQFLPHHGLGTQVAFVWDGLKGFVTGAFTSSIQAAAPGSLLGEQWAWVLTLAYGAMLLIGLVVVVQSSRGRRMLFAVASSLVLTLIASYFRHWPFGFVRTNYYLVPVLVLIAGIGAHRSVQWCRSRVSKVLSRTGPRSRRPVVVVLAVALALLLVAGTMVAALDEVGSYRQVRGSSTSVPYGIQIGDAVGSVRAEARPGAALVVAGVMAIPGWEYYDYEYDGRSTRKGPSLPPGRAAFVVDHGSHRISSFITRLDPGQVFLYIPFGTSGPEWGRDVAQISKGRTCRQTSLKAYSVTGLLVSLTCSTAD